MSLKSLLAAIESPARDRLGAMEGVAFLARLQLVHGDLVEAIDAVYGPGTDELVADLVADALEAAAARPERLRQSDRRREVDPTWFHRPDMIGYVCYADRFAGTLRGVGRQVDYLSELGVTYLHLMPLLEPRPGESDGGYAVADYDAVDPRLGTMADLEELADALHERGVALCVDLVLNHTAREHAWARKALAGDPYYRDFYLVYPDRTGPDAYEAALPEVFPDMAPGSFTFVEQMDSWVWTTFREFQWDLNYANPDVFRAMLATMFALANHGIDVLRLDAVPFLWKRLGTDCQNQPEAHRIVQAYRALTRLATPGLVLKAEAIVGPDMLVQYLGGHDHYRPECDLAYDNQLMVMLWSCVASRDVRLAAQALGRRRPVPVRSGWVTYVRCHDDIGWAVSDEDAAAVGLSGFTHRAFLADFFAGRFPGSFARGVPFQENPATGDARISGSTASLAGLAGFGAGLLAGSPGEVDAALRRIELLHSVIFSFGGIPLIYMGDEIALGNDGDWAADPAHADDNRWIHRPVMDWAAAARRFDPATVEGRTFAAIRRLGELRRGCPALASGGETTVLALENAHVLAYRRVHPRSGPLLVLANFSDHREGVDSAVLNRAGISGPRLVHGQMEVQGGTLVLPAWGYAWVGGL